jgi:hypothetical protein
LNQEPMDVCTVVYNLVDKFIKSLSKIDFMRIALISGIDKGNNINMIQISFDSGSFCFPHLESFTLFEKGQITGPYDEKENRCSACLRIETLICRYYLCGFGDDRPRQII